jgi:hypothetical protein
VEKTACSGQSLPAWRKTLGKGCPAFSEGFERAQRVNFLCFYFLKNDSKRVDFEDFSLKKVHSKKFVQKICFK